MASRESQGKKLNRLLETIEESILNMSDEEILREATEEGVNIDASVSMLRETIQNEITVSRKENLQAARAAYKTATKQRETPSTLTDMTIPDMLGLLKQAIDGGQLTMAFRECKGMSEDDLRNLLSDLDIVGAVDDKKE